MKKMLLMAAWTLFAGIALGAAESRVTFIKPKMRWLWGGFGFHNSEATMTPLMSDEFRDQRVLKTFREISPTYSRLFAGYADWTKEAMDRFADYYDATFRLFESTSTIPHILHTTRSTTSSQQRGRSWQKAARCRFPFRHVR